MSLLTKYYRFIYLHIVTIDVKYALASHLTAYDWYSTNIFMNSFKRSKIKEPNTA